METKINLVLATLSIADTHLTNNIMGYVLISTGRDHPRLICEAMGNATADDVIFNGCDLIAAAGNEEFLNILKSDEIPYAFRKIEAGDSEGKPLKIIASIVDTSHSLMFTEYLREKFNLKKISPYGLAAT